MAWKRYTNIGYRLPRGINVRHKRAQIEARRAATKPTQPPQGEPQIADDLLNELRQAELEPKSRRPEKRRKQLVVELDEILSMSPLPKEERQRQDAERARRYAIDMQAVVHAHRAALPQQPAAPKQTRPENPWLMFPLVIVGAPLVALVSLAAPVLFILGIGRAVIIAVFALLTPRKNKRPQ